MSCKICWCFEMHTCAFPGSWSETYLTLWTRSHVWQSVRCTNLFSFSDNSSMYLVVSHHMLCISSFWIWATSLTLCWFAHLCHSMSCTCHISKNDNSFVQLTLWQTYNVRYIAHISKNDMTWQSANLRVWELVCASHTVTYTCTVL